MYRCPVNIVMTKASGMPDDDRIPRSLTGPWRKVLRYLRGREPDERVADAVTSALAATLRNVKGIPSLPAIAAQMQEAATSGTVTQSRVPASEAARQHVPTDVAERAAASFAATMPEELALVSPGQAALLLARRVVERLAYQYGLDRIGPLVAAEGAYSTDELQVLFAEILASDQVSKLAKRLLARPSAAGLRAPPRRRLRMPLEDLVRASIAELLWPPVVLGPVSRRISRSRARLPARFSSDTRRSLTAARWSTALPASFRSCQLT